MANSLGTLSASLILQEALALATKVHPALKSVVTDFSAEPAVKGQSVITRTLGKPTVNNFGSAATDAADTDVTVTLSNFKEVRYKFTAAEVASTNRDLIRERAMPMALAIGDYLALLISTALADNTNFSTEVVEALADVDYQTLTAAREAITGTLEAPLDNRYAAVKPAAFTKLLNDNLCNRLYKADGADPIASGMLNQIAGFQQVAEWQSWPTTDNGIGAFWHKSSLCVAVRPIANPEAYGIKFPGNIGIVTNPDPTAPFSVLAFESINNSDLSVETVMVFLAGVAKGNNFCARLVTA
jgi:hypothetical protein